MKKLFVGFVLFLLVAGCIDICFQACEDSKHDANDVEYFLSKSPDVGSVVMFAHDAMSREDYSASHKCIDYIKSKGDLYIEELCKLKVDVFGEEIKLLLSNDPDNSMTKIKVLLSDLTPTVTKPTIGTDLSSRGDGGWGIYHEYKEQAQAYNAVLGKLVDVLLALDMTEEAQEFAKKGLEIPIQDTETQKVSGYSEDDAKAIANKTNQ